MRAGTGAAYAHFHTGCRADCYRQLLFAHCRMVLPAYGYLSMLSDNYEGVGPCEALRIYQHLCRAFKHRLECRIHFGFLGMPKMQARGAALATTLSRIVELSLCIAISSKSSYIRPAFERFLKLPGQLKGDFAKQCLPLMGGSLCWGIGFTSYTAIMGHMGTDVAAANSVAAVVRDLICCMCNGIGSAAGIMVGNELGAGHLDRGKAYGIKLKNISYIIGFLSAALVLAVTPFMMRMVVLTAQAREYLLGMMAVMAVYIIGRCINTVVINGVLDGGGDTLFDMYSLIVCMWMLAIPLALVGAFVLHWPPILVYACTCLDEVGKIPWVLLRFRKYKWVQDLTR